jgi:NAD(P)H-nitrite reductase large subunit
MKDEDIIICRCEDVSLAEIKEAIKCGARNFSDIKRLTRCGMGQCQGYTCETLVNNIITAETGIKRNDIELMKIRPPASPITIKEIAGVDCSYE